MKTLSDSLKEQQARYAGINEATLRRCKELWEKSAGLPLYEPPDPKVNVTDYRAFRAQLRDLLAEGRVSLYEVACDHCKTQLVNHEPNAVLMSNPPQKRASCPGCGWIGSVPLGVL